MSRVVCRKPWIVASLVDFIENFKFPIQEKVVQIVSVKSLLLPESHFFSRFWTANSNSALLKFETLVQNKIFEQFAHSPGSTFSYFRCAVSDGHSLIWAHLSDSAFGSFLKQLLPLKPGDIQGITVKLDAFSFGVDRTNHQFALKIDKVRVVDRSRCFPFRKELPFVNDRPPVRILYQRIVSFYESHQSSYDAAIHQVSSETSVNFLAGGLFTQDTELVGLLALVRLVQQSGSILSLSSSTSSCALSAAAAVDLPAVLHPPPPPVSTTILSAKMQSRSMLDVSDNPSHHDRSRTQPNSKKIRMLAGGTSIRSMDVLPALQLPEPQKWLMNWNDRQMLAVRSTGTDQPLNPAFSLVPRGFSKISYQKDSATLDVARQAQLRISQEDEPALTQELEHSDRVRVHQSSGSQFETQEMRVHSACAGDPGDAEVESGSNGHVHEQDRVVSPSDLEFSQSPVRKRARASSFTHEKASTEGDESLVDWAKLMSPEGKRLLVDESIDIDLPFAAVRSPAEHEDNDETQDPTANLLYAFGPNDVNSSLSRVSAGVDTSFVYTPSMFESSTGSLENRKRILHDADESQTPESKRSRSASGMHSGDATTPSSGSKLTTSINWFLSTIIGMRKPR
eukprot:ANDGO_02356.mRNA.1 hypothetical protein